MRSCWHPSLSLTVHYGVSCTVAPPLFGWRGWHPTLSLSGVFAVFWQARLSSVLFTSLFTGIPAILVCAGRHSVSGVLSRYCCCCGPVTVFLLSGPPIQCCSWRLAASAVRSCWKSALRCGPAGRIRGLSPVRSSVVPRRVRHSLTVPQCRSLCSSRDLRWTVPVLSLCFSVVDLLNGLSHSCCSGFLWWFCLVDCPLCRCVVSAASRGICPALCRPLGCPLCASVVYVYIMIYWGCSLWRFVGCPLLAMIYFFFSGSGVVVPRGVSRTSISSF